MIYQILNPKELAHLDLETKCNWLIKHLALNPIDII
jgi:hypothetical protein